MTRNLARYLQDVIMSENWLVYTRNHLDLMICAADYYCF